MESHGGDPSSGQESSYEGEGDREVTYRVVFFDWSALKMTKYEEKYLNWVVFLTGPP